MLSPIPFKNINVEVRDEMGLRLVNGISPCFLAFLRGGIILNVTGQPKILFEEIQVLAI